MSDSTVTVTNISPQLEETHLKELFECCGAITSLSLNKALGTCTVVFAESTHAKAAVFLSGTTLGDRPLTVVIQQAPVAPPPQQHWQPAGGMNPDRFAMINGAGNNPGGLMPNIQFAPNASELNAQNEKKMEEISRTVYIGNVNCELTEDQLRDYLTQTCGPIVIIKMAGETVGKPSRFSFVEFQTTMGAAAAIALDGAPLAGLALKIRKANNAILKPTAPANSTAGGKDVNEIMRKVLAHTNSIASKVKPRSRSRSRDRSRRDRDRDRDRSRGDRDRDRDRDRRSRRSRSRDRDRDRDRRGDRDRRDVKCYNCGGNGHLSRNCQKPRDRSPGRRSGGGMSSKAANDEHAGMYFNGYKWEPIETLNQAAAAPGQASPAMPLGNVRAVMMQQQHAMTLAAQGAQLPSGAMPGMPGQFGLP